MPDDGYPFYDPEAYIDELIPKKEEDAAKVGDEILEYDNDYLDKEVIPCLIL